MFLVEPVVLMVRAQVLFIVFFVQFKMNTHQQMIYLLCLYFSMCASERRRKLRFAEREVLLLTS